MRRDVTAGGEPMRRPTGAASITTSTTVVASGASGPPRQLPRGPARPGSAQDRELDVRRVVPIVVDGVLRDP